MMDAVPENLTLNYTYGSFPNVRKTYDNISEYISSHNLSDNGREDWSKDKLVSSFFLAICFISIFGAVGNGAVIWLLGFRIKRNPFMTYILNLAVVDLGVLLLGILILALYALTARSVTIIKVYLSLFLLLYSASEFFMTAISIDRCASVFFPLWYQCKRPPHLTTIICALIWVLSILLTAISCTLRSLNRYIKNNEERYQFIVNAVLCLPVTTIATVCLFIKFCFKAQQYRRRSPLTIVLFTLLFFLLFGFPLNVTYILYVFRYVPIYALFVSYLLAYLNSSVKPVTYFLVARQWKSRHSESTKNILQKVFKEEENCAEEAAAEIKL